MPSQWLYTINILLKFYLVNMSIITSCLGELLNLDAEALPDIAFFKHEDRSIKPICPFPSGIRPKRFTFIWEKYSCVPVQNRL